jgi:hypothetical protein
MGLFDKLSPDFAESLRQVADQLREKKQAQCGCQDGPTSPVAQDLKDKDSGVDEAMDLIKRFDDRIIREWLYSLDEQSLSEVARLFAEVNQVGAIQFGGLMKASGACCPWKLIGDMFAPAEEGALIVIEDKGPAEGNAPPEQL